MKKVFSLVAMAIVFASCSTIKVVPGKQVAFKELIGKKVVLSERPGPEDSIVITVIKKY